METEIDNLHKLVSTGGITIPNSTISIREVLSTAPNAIFSLSRYNVGRVFTILGRQNDMPTGTGAENLKLAPVKLYEIMFGTDSGDGPHESSDSDGESIDENSENEDVQSNSDEEKGVSGEISAVSRQSPRRRVAFERENRVNNVASNELIEMKERLKKMEQENATLKRISVDNKKEIAGALRLVPSIIANTGGKVSKKSRRKHKKRGKSGVGANLGHKHGKRDQLYDSSSTESSTSSDSDDSSSSSSSSDSSSSDSRGDGRRRRRWNHRGRTKRRSHSPTKYAKEIINRIGRDGFIPYLNRVVMVTQGAGKKIDHRSVHEATNIGSALDEFILDGISSKLRGIEILTTRFIGLVHVIKTGRWDFLEGIQSSAATTDASPLSAKQMAKIIKQGATITAVSTPVVKSSRVYADTNRNYGDRNATGSGNGNF